MANGKIKVAKSQKEFWNAIVQTSNTDNFYGYSLKMGSKL